MLNNRTLAIVKRELKMKLFSKTFIFMTLLIPLFMVGIMAIQILIHSLSDEPKSNIIIISDSDEISEKVKDEIIKVSEVKAGMVTVLFQKLDLDSFKIKLAQLKPDLLSNKLTGVVLLPSSSLQTKEIDYYSTNPNNAALFSRIKPAINKSLVDIYFANKKLTQDEISFARKDVDVKGFRVSKEEKVEEEGFGNQIALFLFTFLLYMALIFAGTMTLNSVVEEKSNKIVEVLLSSASSTELMAGKIIGIVIVEVLQMVVWLSPILLLISTSWFFLPAEFMPSMSIQFLIYFLFNYSLSLITYVALYATLGAIFDNPQDAQSGMWPLLMLIMIPFFIALGLQANPQSTLAQAASLFPFASLIVMPARMILVDVPLWQVLISIVINIVVLIGVVKLAGKIYRIGILLTGKKPKWSEVYRWLKMS